MTQLSYLLTLEFDGEPTKYDIQNRLYGILEVARASSQITGDDEEVACIDIEVNLQ